MVAIWITGNLEKDNTAREEFIECGYEKNRRRIA